MPKPTEGIPIARPGGARLDLLAAIDAAILAGDAHAARVLVAKAARLERERGEAKAPSSASAVPI
jgi:hypothetical protein